MDDEQIEGESDWCAYHLPNLLNLLTYLGVKDVVGDYGICNGAATKFASLGPTLSSHEAYLQCIHS